MARFKIHTLSLKNGPADGPVYIYDTTDSTLVDSATGNPVVAANKLPYKDADRVSSDNPLGKSSPRTLKIQLGLSCNFTCEYCSQRFVPHQDEGNPDKVAGFVAGLDGWVTTPPERIEFWGGEPLVYVKTLKPLAEAVRAKYPDAGFFMVTNGSLLTKDLNQWLDDMGFVIAISHDGPGQHVRGPDPLADPDTKEAILDLWNRLGSKNRISFNAMLNKHNTSRAAIQKFFSDLLGVPNPPIGEGDVIDAYDEGGAANSFDHEEAVEFRKQAFGEIRSGLASSFSTVSKRVVDFVETLRTGKPDRAVGQKCGMDSPDNLTVDLNGDVITCQNVSAAATNPAGVPHKMGNVSNMSEVKLAAATHWSHRDECPKCPMLHICKGSCMFLSGPLWEASCNNSFANAVPIFAAAIEYLTGNVPMAIEGPQREDRQFLWENTTPRKKFIEIKAV